MPMKLLKATRLLEWADTLLFFCIACVAYTIYTGVFFDLYFIMVYVIASAIYGFGINSLADSKADRAVGKNKDFNRLSRKSTFIFIIISGLIILFMPFYLWGIYVGFYSIIIFFLINAYSVRPLRLKERGLIGIIVSSSCRGMLPLFILSFLMESHHNILLYLGIWLFLTEFVGDMIHHIGDYHNDILSKTDTWIQRIGMKKSRLVTKISLIVLFIYIIIPGFFGQSGSYIMILLTVATTHCYIEDLMHYW
jgi:4-hydroxybenzoate polyprenyltransferase